MVTAEESRILRMIRDLYGPMIVADANPYGHRPEVLAGIMMRESRGGEALDPPGPAGTGDGGHGRGVMQVDDRWHKEFCTGDDWRDPERNITKGAEILQGKRRYLAARVGPLGLKNDLDLERASIAAYNCGEGNVRKALATEPPLDVDYYTAHHNYSREVLRFADAYRGLEA